MSNETKAGPCYLEVPIPTTWFTKPDGNLEEPMTFAQALASEAAKRALALMKEIDDQLGLQTEVRLGIHESPHGAYLVLSHVINEAVDRERLRYIAAVKGKSLLDQSAKSATP